MNYLIELKIDKDLTIDFNVGNINKPEPSGNDSGIVGIGEVGYMIVGNSPEMGDIEIRR